VFFFCVCVCKRERKSKRMSEKEGEERERERERARERARERERERERELAEDLLTSTSHISSSFYFSFAGLFSIQGSHLHAPLRTLKCNFLPGVI